MGFQAVMAVVTVATGAKAIEQGEKARKAQQQAAAAQRKQQRVQAEQSQRRANREVLIKRAQAKAQAEALGGSGGSAIAGGLASLSSQFGSAVGFAGQMSGLSQNINMFQSQAASAQARAEMFSNLSGTAGNLGGYAGIQDFGTKLFG